MVDLSFLDECQKALIDLEINWLLYFGKILPRMEIKDRRIYGTDFPLIETPLFSPYYYTFKAKFSKL